MPSLELCALSEHLDPPAIEALAEQLASAEAAALDIDEDAQTVPIDQGFDGDAFDDFWDQLDANDAACDVYLPVEFEETFTVEGTTFGSAHALLLALANLKEEMFIEGDDDEGDDDQDDDGGFDDGDGDYGAGFGDPGSANKFSSEEDESHIELKDEQMRLVWKSMHRAARQSVKRQLALFIHNH